MNDGVSLLGAVEATEDCVRDDAHKLLKALAARPLHFYKLEKALNKSR